MTSGLREFAERALLLSLCIATAAAVLFAGLNDLQPVETPWTFSLVFLQWSVAFYGIALPALLLLVWGLSRLALRAAPRASVVRRLPAAALALCGGGFLVACALWNQRAVAAVFALGGPARFRWLSPLALLVATAGIVLCVLPVRRRLAAHRVAALLAVACAAIAFLPQATARAELPRPRPVLARDAARRLLVFGIDGADWTLMERLFARGELPNLAALRRRGAWGHLQTLFPTRSPAIWTTIATGQPPDRHGVEAFTSRRVSGVHGAFRHGQPPRRIGFERLFSVLRAADVIVDGPVPSSARRVAALWNLATDAGSPVAVVDWWATWPAEPVLGAIVSDRVNYWRQAERGHAPEDSGLTYPADLAQEIAGLIVAPEAVTLDDARPFMDVSPAEFEQMMARPFRGKTVESEFKYLDSMYETNRRLALHVIERTRREYGSPADLMVLFRTVDIASHSALQLSELVTDHLGAPPEDVRRFGRVVSEAYRSVDRALGDVMAALGEVNVVVVSDHGFALETTGTGADETRVYHHMLAPPGVFLAAGPAFRAGRVEGLTVYDLLPMLAVLKRFPLAANLPGHLHEEVFDPVFLASAPIVRVPSYGRRSAGRAPGRGSAADEDALERLRALGYIK
jgi:hypothetical protein